MGMRVVMGMGCGVERAKASTSGNGYGEHETGCFVLFISFSIPQSTHFKASRLIEHSFSLLNVELTKACWLVMLPMQKASFGYPHLATICCAGFLGFVSSLSAN